MSKATVARITISTNQFEVMEQIEIDLETWEHRLSKKIIWMEIQEGVESAINRSKEELADV